MTLKKLLLLSLVLLPAVGLAQDRSFAFSEIQSRNDRQQWGDTKYVGMQVARFSSDKIDVKADKDYRLNIISKTDLPDNGVIYLCKDEKSNPVTVMLIDNIKMYLYSQSKRFLINFDSFVSQATMADTD